MYHGTAGLDLTQVVEAIATNLVQEEILGDLAIPVIEPGADARVQKLLPLASVLTYQRQLWQV